MCPGFAALEGEIIAIGFDDRLAGDFLDYLKGQIVGFGICDRCILIVKFQPYLAQGGFPRYWSSPLRGQWNVPLRHQIPSTQCVDLPCPDCMAVLDGLKIRAIIARVTKAIEDERSRQHCVRRRIKDFFQDSKGDAGVWGMPNPLCVIIP